ncbi:hypothetical protein [Thalassobaculum salexigens]|uniref:hypothetical protein n=1 Tax=Thalassobaculum salexigens TaxID=455360 RepID=UPI0012EB77C4|nr:hypothetical protein [Thalassobaculum salexigens]
MAVVIMLFWLIPAITVVGYSNQSYQYKDSLQMALQLGRLDFATMLLTVLTVFLIIVSLISFSYFRSIAEKEAREVAAEVAEQAAAEAASKMASHVAKLVSARVARQEANRIIPPLVRRSAAEWNEFASDGASQNDVADLRNALDQGEDNGSSR